MHGVDSVDYFDGEYRFLSNFYPSPITIGGRDYASVEHAYQAFKAINETDHEAIRTAKSPAVAKRLGKHVPLRKDWEYVKVDVMRKLVERKFRDPELRIALLATGEMRLTEGNTWNDHFWGVCHGTGKNWLGRILEEVRKKINEEVTLTHE